VATFEMDFPYKTGSQKRNMLFLAHNYTLPNESDFFAEPEMLFQGYITTSSLLIM